MKPKTNTCCTAVYHKTPKGSFAPAVWYSKCACCSKWHYVTTSKIVIPIKQLGVDLGTWTAFSRNKTTLGGDHVALGQLLVACNKCTLTIYPGYSWDGASCCPDFTNIMLPSLVHDALYQSKKCGVDTYTWSQVDGLFLLLMKTEGMNWLLRNICWSAVRTFGGLIRSKPETPPGLLINPTGN